MKPMRLVALSGPLAGQNWSLDGSEISIGRRSTNDISLDDDSVSRNHCRLEREGAQWRIVDLDSRNGVFVDSIPVRNRVLKPGCQIAIGSSVFVLLEADSFVPAASDKPVLKARFKTTLTREDVIYLHPEKALLRLNADSVKGISALLEINAALLTTSEVPSFYSILLDRVLAYIPAEAGIVLCPAGKREWEVAAPRGAECCFPHLIDEVATDRKALLSQGVDQAGNAAWVLAAPLMSGQNLSAVLCLTSSHFAFLEEHLQLLAATAVVAGASLEKVRQIEWLVEENRRLSSSDPAHEMIGESRAMKELYASISRVAPTDSTVLILGENGTGKEMTARAIHAESPRASRPFVAINCATLSEALLESELFGHEKGAFTGAVARKIGKFEVADGGSVLLDEVSELAPAIQQKLLRVLQEREFERVGGTEPIRVDIRLIAATNADLPERIKAGKFREDLYYRLNVVSLRLPSLKERTEDIPLLARYFLARYGQRTNRKVVGISPDCMAHLMQHDWPGNVRELQNAMERAVVMGSSEILQPEDLPESLLEKKAPPGVCLSHYQDAINEAKRQVILAALEQAGGNYPEAARILGLGRTYLHRLITSMNLRPETRRG